jgi:hypothetical protein
MVTAHNELAADVVMVVVIDCKGGGATLNRFQGTKKRKKER